MAVHLRSAQVDPAADAELQRWVHRWPERWLTHTSTHMSELTCFTHDVKSLYLAFPIKQLEDVMWVWRKLREEREPAASPLYQLSSWPPPIPPAPAWGPTVYFFMNVWIRWKWGSIGFGFGFQGLTCYCTRTHTNSLSHSHTASQMDWSN